MMAISHTIASAAIGDKINNPYAAFVIAFVFHFICDSFLHWNFYPRKFKHIGILAVADTLAGLFFAYFLLGENFWHKSVLFAILGGLLPDIISFSAYFLNIKIPVFSKFHDDIQRETKIVWKGLISQIIIVVISVVLIIRF